MRDEEPPESHRARIVNLGDPLTAEPIELGGSRGLPGETPMRVMAYVIDPIDIEFVDSLADDYPPPPELPLETKATRRLPRLGWSLIIAAISDATVGVAAIVSDSTVIGIVSSVAVGICSVLLVAAEAKSQLGRSRRKPTPQRPLGGGNAGLWLTDQEQIDEWVYRRS